MVCISKFCVVMSLQYSDKIVYATKTKHGTILQILSDSTYSGHLFCIYSKKKS